MLHSVIKCTSCPSRSVHHLEVLLPSPDHSAGVHPTLPHDTHIDGGIICRDVHQRPRAHIGDNEPSVQPTIHDVNRRWQALLPAVHAQMVGHSTTCCVRQVPCAKCVRRTWSSRRFEAVQHQLTSGCSLFIPDAVPVQTDDTMLSQSKEHN